MPRPFTLVAAIVWLVGCHLVFPHHPGSGSSGGDGHGLDGARLELGILDGIQRVEHATRDQRPVGDLGPCSESQSHAAGYAPVCPLDLASCPQANLDCDALAGFEDPYADCNSLAYDQGFETDVIGAGTFQPLPSTGAWSWSCGKLQQNSTANSYSTAIAKDIPSKLPTDYLVETRVKLGAKGSGSTHWRVGVIGRVTYGSVFYFMGCWIWENPNAGSGNPVPDPDLLVTLKNAETDLVAGGGIEAWPFPHKTVPSLAAAAGSEYTLQLWFTPDLRKFYPALNPVCATAPDCPAVLCRVCDKTSCFHNARYAIYEKPGHLKYLPPTPGSIGVRTLNRAATFDYLRVHELKSP